jgi:putative ABC transport system permease protein
MAAYDTNNFTLTGHGEAFHIQGAVVSADLFSLLGVRPALGRTFRPDEDKLPAANGAFAIILSHHLWQEAFWRQSRNRGPNPRDRRPRFYSGSAMPAGFQFPIQGEA